MNLGEYIGLCVIITAGWFQIVESIDRLTAKIAELFEMPKEK